MNAQDLLKLHELLLKVAELDGKTDPVALSKIRFRAYMHAHFIGQALNTLKVEVKNG